MVMMMMITIIIIIIIIYLTAQRIKYVVVFDEVYILFHFNSSVSADRLFLTTPTPHLIVSTSLSLFLSSCLNFSLQGVYNIGNCDNS